MNSSNLRVLVVDDEALLLLNFVDMLEDLGHQADSATSGEAALERLQSQTFDVLITDQTMPRMTGAELAVEARRIRPSIAVILATGQAETPSELKEAVTRLGKPFSEKQLAQALSDALRQKVVRPEN